MKNISRWYVGCLLVVVALLTAYRIQASSTETKVKDPDIARLEQLPSRSLSYIRPTDLAGLLLIEETP